MYLGYPRYIVFYITHFQVCFGLKDPIFIDLFTQENTVPPDNKSQAYTSVLAVSVALDAAQQTIRHLFQNKNSPVYMAAQSSNSSTNAGVCDTVAEHLHNHLQQSAFGYHPAPSQQRWNNANYKQVYHEKR